MPFELRRSWRAGLAGLLVVAVVIALVPALLRTDRTVTAAVPLACTNPPPKDHQLTPQALRERYGIQPLLDAHYDGRGQTAVLIEFNQSVDITTLDEWKACLNVHGPPVTQKAMPGEDIPLPPSPCGDSPLPACFGEAQGDAYSMVTGAPGLDRLYVIVSTNNEGDALAHIVDELRMGNLTDGRRPDVVSLSFGMCQREWTQKQVDKTEASLRALAEAGTWFFKAAGDAGPSDCSQHPKCEPENKGPDMGYPAASRWVTAVGGTSIPGATPDDPTGQPVVWNEHEADPAAKTNCAAGAGCLSIFATPGYQQAVPDGRVPPKRGLPDVAALAGAPGYLNLTSSGEWFGNGGTSLASPLYASAFASIRSMLLANGVTPPVVLDDAIYSIAADPVLYARVFDDVVTGDNDIYGVHCCTAETGYDLASGLGEVHIDQMAATLAAASSAPPTSTTTTTTAPTTPPPLLPRTS